MFGGRKSPREGLEDSKGLCRLLYNDVFSCQVNKLDGKNIKKIYFLPESACIILKETGKVRLTWVLENVHGYQLFV